MDTGLLCFSNDAKEKFYDKVLRASQTYLRKYNTAPDTCYVNTADGVGVEQVAGINIKHVKNILPNHFWIGVEVVP